MHQVQRPQNYGKILIDESWFYEIVLDNLDLHRTRLLPHSLIEEARLVLFIHCQDPLRKRPKDMLYCTREGSGLLLQRLFFFRAVSRHKQITTHFCYYEYVIVHHYGENREGFVASVSFYSLVATSTQFSGEKLSLSDFTGNRGNHMWSLQHVHSAVQLKGGLDFAAL